jgi:hypothetical protein
MDLIGRETSDTLARNMLRRYRYMGHGELLAMAGEGEVDPGDLGDKTLDLVDYRSPEELRNLGFHRRLRVTKRSGPVPGVNFFGKTSWKSVGGRIRSFTYGVATYVPQEAVKKLKDAPGFQQQTKAPQWGRARSWSRRPPSVSGNGTSSGRRRAVNGFEGLMSKARSQAKEAYVDSDYRARNKPPRVQGDPALVASLTGPDGLLAKRHEEVVKSRQQRAKLGPTAEEEEEFFARTLPADLPTIEAMEIPDGEYLYSLDVLDRGPKGLLGVYTLREDLQEFFLIARLEGDPRILRLHRDQILATSFWNGKKGADWTLHRSEDRLTLIQRGKGLGEKLLILHTLMNPDGEALGTTMTRREIATFLAKQGLVSSQRPQAEQLQQFLKRGS